MDGRVDGWGFPSDDGKLPLSLESLQMAIEIDTAKKKIEKERGERRGRTHMKSDRIR